MPTRKTNGNITTGGYLQDILIPREVSDGQQQDLKANKGLKKDFVDAEQRWRSCSKTAVYPIGHVCFVERSGPGSEGKAEICRNRSADLPVRGRFSSRLIPLLHSTDVCVPNPMHRVYDRYCYYH